MRETKVLVRLLPFRAIAGVEKRAAAARGLRDLVNAGALAHRVKMPLLFLFVNERRVKLPAG